MNQAMLGQVKDRSLLCMGSKGSGLQTAAPP